MSEIGSISHETRYSNSQKEILTSQTTARSISLWLTLFMTNNFKENPLSHCPLKIACHLDHRLSNTRNRIIIITVLLLLLLLFNWGFVIKILSVIIIIIITIIIIIIRKLCTKSVQYLPKLWINGVLIPCVNHFVT